MVKKKSRLKRILITGIPGSGKTAIGNYFRDELNYAHCDLERIVSMKMPVYFEKLIHNLGICRKDVIVTWGLIFPPVPNVNLINRLKSKGFRLFWFDGNRPAAFSAYVKRGTMSELDFYTQMALVEENKVIEHIEPILINPFKDDSSFRRKSDIAKEILRSMRDTRKN